jgi:hypothetical protein
MGRPQPISAVDRRATDLPGRRGDYAEVVVADPYSPDGGRALVIASIKDDPLGKMGARSQIDGAQLAAGRRWQADYERSEIGGIKANDTTREPVDGGGAYPDPISDQTMGAVRRLAEAREALGIEGESLVRDVLAGGLSIELVCARRNLTTERERKYIGRRFREALETLAMLYGLTNKFGKNREGRRTI